MNETKVLAPIQDEQQVQDVARVADALSLSLLFTLGRQYLDVPFGEADFLQPVVTPESSPESAHFLRVDQVGDPLAGSLHQPFTALQTALAACHDPGRYTLLFVVVGERGENRIYLGVRGHGADSQAYAFVDYLGHFLRGNWPGTRLQRCDHRQEIQPRIVLPMCRWLHHATALTGIPSLKPGDNPGYPQSIDRLLRGLRGRRFMYVVVAEPMSQGEVNQIIYQCRDLIGRTHALTKTTLTETLTKGLSESIAEAESRATARANQTGESVSRSNRSGVNLKAGIAKAGIAIGARLLATWFPPAALMSIIGGAVLKQLAPSSDNTSGTTRSTNQTDTTTITTSETKTTGWTRSEAQALGREYIDAHAQAAEALLQRYIARFEQARTLGCWDVGAYFLAEDPDTALQGAAQMRALLSGEKSAFEPIRAHDLARVWTRGAQVALSNFEQPALALVHPETRAPLLHPLGPTFSGLTTPLNTEELALLVNLPRREVPGVRVMPTADFSLNPPAAGAQDLVLGHVLEGGEPIEPIPLPYTLPFKTLAKHALVTGITGSGKSQTCLRLLAELQRRRIPFLVVEPAKDEYVEWATRLNDLLPEDSPDRLAIYMPGATVRRGRQLRDELRLNPLEIVWPSEETAPPILSHIDRLKSIMIAAFPMQEVLPILLEEVLFLTYQVKGWLSQTPPAFGTPAPSLTDLVNIIDPHMRSKGYEKSIVENLSAALKTRLQSLQRGWKGRLFNPPDGRSTPWGELFDRPAVVNLSCLGDDADKAFAMAVLILFLYEYRQAQHDLSAQSDADGADLRHLTVIEEAHRILLRAAPGTPEHANPQGKVAEMFANALSEIRAYRQGFLIVDQVPARLVPDAVKNTNLKIVHRLVADDDRQAMASCMSLTADQTAIINRLRPGQAIVAGDLDDRAAWIKVLMQGPHASLVTGAN